MWALPCDWSRWRLPKNWRIHNVPCRLRLSVKTKQNKRVVRTQTGVIVKELEIILWNKQPEEKAVALRLLCYGWGDLIESHLCFLLNINFVSNVFMDRYRTITSKWISELNNLVLTEFEFNLLWNFLKLADRQILWKCLSYILKDKINIKQNYYCHCFQWL